jgi:hypothetical protein
MAKKQIRQICGKKRILGCPPLSRGRLFVMELTLFESAQCLRIDPVFIGENRRHAAFGHAASDEFLNTLQGGLSIGTSMGLLEQGPLSLLRGPHRATTAQFSLTHPVDEMRSPHKQVQVEGPVLAVLKSPKTVKDQGLVRARFGANLFMKEKAVAAEAFRLVLECAVGDAKLTADLAKAGAADEPMEKNFQKVGISQPVGGGEGL